MRKVKIERLTESVTLGEAPHWDPATQSVYYVDIIGMTVQKYTPATKTYKKAHVGPQQVSFIIPIEGKDSQFIISQGRQIVRVLWDFKNDEVVVIEKLVEVEDEEDKQRNRFNDGKCDEVGRLWAGTLSTIADSLLDYPAKGALYSLQSGSRAEKHLENVRISNGVAFSADSQLLYYIDSAKGTVDQYDFDLDRATISNCTPIFTLAKHGIAGLPDGLTIDTQDNLWIAIFNGGRVIQIDPRTPETLLRTIEIPAKQVTSLTFGGEDLDELFVTTGAFKIDNIDVSGPENGALYRVSGLGVRGAPANNFRLK